MPRGRPTLYSEDLADSICTAISGGKSLREILSAEGMPVRSAVYRWADQYPEFKDKLARAQQDCADWYADQAVQAALKAKDKDSASAARVQSATFLALAKVHDPRRYGDQARFEVEHSGTVNTGMTVTVNVVPARAEPVPIDVEPEKPALPQDNKICGE